MRLAVLDASAVGGGPVTRAVECAAGEARHCGVEVVSIRLYALFGTSCASCGDCRATGRCARRHRALEEAARVLASSDMLLVGVSSAASQRDPRAEALLRRLVGSFGGVYDSRHGESQPGSDGIRKRAALVSAAPPLLGIPAALGVLPYGLAGVWRVLDRAGVDVVGTASVASRWAGPASWDLTRERATKLGRTLALSNGAPRLRPVPPRRSAPAVRRQPRGVPGMARPRVA